MLSVRGEEASKPPSRVRGVPPDAKRRRVPPGVRRRATAFRRRRGGKPKRKRTKRERRDIHPARGLLGRRRSRVPRRRARARQTSRRRPGDVSPLAAPARAVSRAGDPKPFFRREKRRRPLGGRQSVRDRDVVPGRFVFDGPALEPVRGAGRGRGRRERAVASARGEQRGRDGRKKKERHVFFSRLLGAVAAVPRHGERRAEQVPRKQRRAREAPRRGRNASRDGDGDGDGRRRRVRVARLRRGRRGRDSAVPRRRRRRSRVGRAAVRVHHAPPPGPHGGSTGRARGAIAPRAASAGARAERDGAMAETRRRGGRRRRRT